MLNLTQVETFVTVVDQGGFHEAARHLGVSQPTVTQHIKKLEADLMEERKKRERLIDFLKPKIQETSERQWADIVELREELHTVMFGQMKKNMAVRHRLEEWTELTKDLRKELQAVKKERLEEQKERLEEQKQMTEMKEELKAQWIAITRLKQE